MKHNQEKENFTPDLAVKWISLDKGILTKIQAQETLIAILTK